ncbi:MAG: DNA primase [Candidatus Staskawiczbacteria bacterium]|nr:DNA primase [Candidatus Staskawiczbacteria bacterium]
MDSQIEEIKNRLNVLDVVGAYVKLSKTGVNYRGICPFHSEKGPSFFVSPSRQMWKCFGCGKGGDIFEFIKEIEGVEFGDALKILANKAGIELKRENPKLRTERQRLYEICDLACSFFEKQLGSSAWGKEAKEYLQKRGITEESIKKWRLGYSPDTWQGLSDFLVGKGYKREEIVNAGLAVKSDKGNNPYDRFRGRIIFPIFDLSSQPVGFGARIFKEVDKKEAAKYINTPQTLLYDKSSILYGLNNAKLPVRKNNQCVLTEGYTDTIMAHQAGFENTVSVSGTALTGQHLNLLKRYSDNLLLAFDMDLAGDTATKRGINLAESAGFNLKIINKYSEKDPAEIILENPENWKDALAKARAIMDYYFDSAFLKYDKATPDGKKDIGKIILPAIKRLQNKIEQSYWVQKLAEKLGVSQEAVLEELKAVKAGESYQPISKEEHSNILKNVGMSKIKDNSAVGRKKLLEDKIVALVINEPENLNLIEETHRSLFSEQAKKFIDELRGASGDKAIFADILKKDEYKDLANTLALRAEVDYEEDGLVEIQLCLSELKGIELRNSLNNMLSYIRSEKDEQKKEGMIREFNSKARELHKKS